MTTPTPTFGGESVGTTDGIPVFVEQGPPWLARLLFSPPDWLPPLLGFGVLAAAVWIGYHLTDREPDREETLAMVQNVLTVVGCGGVTVLLVRHMDFSYVIDVGVGSSVGFALAVCGRLLTDRLLDQADML